MRDHLQAERQDDDLRVAYYPDELRAVPSPDVAEHHASSPMRDSLILAGGALAVLLAVAVIVMKGPASSRASDESPRATSSFAVSYPANHAIVTTPGVTVYGTAPAGSTITIGSSKTRADDRGEWQMGVRLKRGDNTIVIRATDATGVAQTDILTLRH